MWLFLLTVFQFSSGCWVDLASFLPSSPPLIVWWLQDNPRVNRFIRIIGPPASSSLVIVNGYKTLSQPTFNKNWNIACGKVSRPTSTNWNSLMVVADLNARPTKTSKFPEIKRVWGGRMFELVQCWSKECAAGVGGRDVVVVSQRFPNIQTIHITAEQEYRQIICPKYFPETKSTLVLCLIFFKVFIFKICSDISSVVMCICRASLH